MSLPFLSSPPSRRHAARTVAVLGASVVLTAALLPSAAPASLVGASAAPAAAPSRELPKVPVMVGTGGAVSSVDRDASQVGVDVLARGGNAADAAVATAAALGVTEPYSAGIGGGGFLVYYDAAARTVTTIDGREAAPATFTPTTFIGQDGNPLPFAAAVSSGLSVGVPGTPALWDKAARTLGTKSLDELLRPAENLARNGFVVDQTYFEQTAQNQARFSLFPETVRVYLPGGAPPAVGSTVTNPDLAKAYRELRTAGVSSLYAGRLGRALVAEARTPTTTPGTSVYPGQVTMADLRAYRAPVKEPTHAQYRGADVYGMGLPSSGGIAVAEILNLVESYERRTGLKLRDLSELDYLHWFSEASATAFADRNRYVGDVPGVPVQSLLRQQFADERACLLDPWTAQPRPVPFGDPSPPFLSCARGSVSQETAPDVESTTHLTVADRWGNVAAYTLTIEQTGGSGITVPGWGFLLNNELTDFNFAPLSPGVPDPNLPGPGKRPRSSMSPTIVVRDGQPVVALGSPGGATIITSVAQTLLGHLDRGLPLVDAIAAPRLSSRNGGESAEPAITGTELGTGLTARGHVLVPTLELGAVAAVRILPGGRLLAAAEPVRRGGGSAMVVNPGG